MGKDAIWGKGTLELFNGFDKCRTLQRPLPRFAPETRSLFDQTGLRAVTRQQLRLAFGNLRELAFEGFGDASVKCASGLAQQRAISRILHKSVLEQIGRMGRRALAEHQTGFV